jgi:hypothetical protein
MMAIPKRIFFFWGNKTMSWLRYLTLRSFRELNPDWEMILYKTTCIKKDKPWVEEVNQDFFEYRGIDYTNELDKLRIQINEWSLPELPDIGASHLSNFLKWYKLYAHGGIYADMDILWVKPIDKLYEQMIDYDTAICVTKFLSIGLLAAHTTNKMFKDLFDNALNTYDPKHYQCVGVNSIYRLLYGDKIFKDSGEVNWNALALCDIFNDIKAMWPFLKIFNIPFKTVYPYGCTDMFKVFVENHPLPEETIGLHWYAGCPLAQRGNNELSPDNLPDKESTLSRLARRYA